jgi:hypothetical protein
MLPGERLRGAISKRIPFRVMIPILYLIWFFTILLWIVFLPLAFLYRSFLIFISWYALPRQGKDLMVVTNGGGNYGPWLSQIMLGIEARCLFLNYAEQSSWRTWSLPVRLFRSFGPKPIPLFFMPHCLPAVIVFQRFRQPKNYSFGDLCKDPESRLAELRTGLATDA